TSVRSGGPLTRLPQPRFAKWYVGMIWAIVASVAGNVVTGTHRPPRIAIAMQLIITPGWADVTSNRNPNSSPIPANGRTPSASDRPIASQVPAGRLTWLTRTAARPTSTEDGRALE